MSAYTAFEATSQTLKKLMQDRIDADGDLGNTVTVLLKTPKEMGSEKGVSLWLYRVVRNEFCLNNPPQRVDARLQRRTPLPFCLHYLVTPLLDLSETEQKVLGKVLQIFYDHPVVRGVDLTGSLQNTAVELRVTLESLSLEEVTRVWTALNSESGYQLSVSYEVQVVEIDSAFEAESITPVVELVPKYHVIVGSSESVS
jgi:Pvc16 N-terminal domain